MDPPPSLRIAVAQRARIVLLAAEGLGSGEIVRRAGSASRRWSHGSGGMMRSEFGGLGDRPEPGRPRTTDDVAIVLPTPEPPPERPRVTH